MKNNINIQNKVVDFKSHYNKTKIAKMVLTENSNTLDKSG